MHWLGVMILVYGVLLILGGIIGFLVANSIPSLIAGLFFGVLMLLFGYAIRHNSFRAVYWAFAFTLALLFFFGYRYYLSHKIMPSGIMAVLSLIVCVLLFVMRNGITKIENRR